MIELLARRRKCFALAKAAIISQNSHNILCRNSVLLVKCVYLEGLGQLDEISLDLLADI